MEFIGYIGALAIGIVLGLTGGGGSLLTVPLLVYFLHFNPVVATAYSLFIVGTTSVFGAFQNYRLKNIDFKNGFLFAIPSFIGVYLTRRFIIQSIPKTIFENDNILITKSTVLMVLFSIIMLAAALSMLKKKIKIEQKPNQLIIIIQTFIIGIIIGLIGAGGGFLIIPTLVLFSNLSMRKAIGTSLLIIAMNSLIGFIGDIQNLTIDWLFLIKFTSISIIGIFIGIYTNKFVNDQQLRKGFAYFILAIAFFILFKELIIV